MSVIYELLNDKDVDPNGKNPFCENWTALHYAVNCGYYEIVKILVE